MSARRSAVDHLDALIREQLGKSAPRPDVDRAWDEVQRLARAGCDRLGEETRARRDGPAIGPRRETAHPRRWRAALAVAAICVFAIGAWALVDHFVPNGRTVFAIGDGLGESEVGQPSAIRPTPDIWSWQPGQSQTEEWIKLDPNGLRPSARRGHTMVYVPPSDLMVLFGGRGDMSLLGDTWTYDPLKNAWSEVDRKDGDPSARENQAMIFAANTGRAILFGGRGDAGLLNDTWSYDPQSKTWARLEPGGVVPAARESASFAWDPLSERAFLFGGEGKAGLLNDLWSYDPATNVWTQLQPVDGDADERPSPRSGQGMAVVSWGEATTDGWSGTLLVFGGQSAEGDLVDMWQYDPTAGAWAQRPPANGLPGAASSVAMAACAEAGQMVLVEPGQGDLTGLADTWVFFPPNAFWNESKLAGPRPSARWGGSFVARDGTPALMLFGGEGIDGGLLDDTWLYRPGIIYWGTIDGSAGSPVGGPAVWPWTSSGALSAAASSPDLSAAWDVVAQANMGGRIGSVSQLSLYVGRGGACLGIHGIVVLDANHTLGLEYVNGTEQTLGSAATIHMKARLSTVGESSPVAVTPWSPAQWFTVLDGVGLEGIVAKAAEVLGSNSDAFHLVIGAGWTELTRAGTSDESAFEWRDGSWQSLADRNVLLDSLEHLVLRCTALSPDSSTPESGVGVLFYVPEGEF